MWNKQCRLAAGVAFFAAIGMCSPGEKVYGAGNVDAVDALGSWTTYCTPGSQGQSQDSCSIISFVRAKDDHARWAKVAFYFSNNGVKALIRTPRLNYFKQGVSIAIDGAQIGRVFVDTCDDAGWCDFPTAVELAQLGSLTSGKDMVVEYRLSKDDGVRLVVPLGGLLHNLTKLYDRISDEKNEKIAGQSKLNVFAYMAKWFGKPASQIKPPPVSVELRDVEEAINTFRNAQNKHAKSMVKCAEPAVFGINSDLTAVSKSDEVHLVDWAKEARKCIDAKEVWLVGFGNIQQTDGTLDLLSKAVVKDALVSQGLPVNKIVVTDTSGQMALQSPGR